MNEPENDQQAEPGLESGHPRIPRMSTIDPDAELYKPPPLEITAADRTQFLRCLASGTPYSESFSKGKDTPVTVTFRVKSRRETEYLMHEVANDFTTGVISQPTDFIYTVNTYNLRIQTVRLMGEEIPQIVIPKRPWVRKKPGDTDSDPAATASPLKQFETIFGEKPDGMATEAPAPPGSSLRSQIESGFMADLSDSMMFVLVGMLSQFDSKVQRLQREILDPSFI